MKSILALKAENFDNGYTTEKSKKKKIKVNKLNQHSPSCSSLFASMCQQFQSIMLHVRCLQLFVKNYRDHSGMYYDLVVKNIDDEHRSYDPAHNSTKELPY
ncbi:signal peptidase complex catalytic subunit SEC11 [Striga asiatica]|uniref:Signal peptidase complex catalytic subunit SEC11 n=1 Tax=Striga asiatica TaxID=4170 RepID=A0A5A7R361_STRAF|nr:signal peptidase complex catalytic subunit SEC11 [Striga asiatica]